MPNASAPKVANPRAQAIHRTLCGEFTTEFNGADALPSLENGAGRWRPRSVKHATGAALKAQAERKGMR